MHEELVAINKRFDDATVSMNKLPCRSASSAESGVYSVLQLGFGAALTT